MSSLRNEPPQPVESLDELFALAHAMEDEAAARYSEIAGRLRADGNPALAEVFERLAAEERGHLGEIARWSQSERGKAPDPSLVRWRIPETFDDEGVGAGNPRLMTAYRSLAMAVRNEERAFAFWSYVVAHAGDPAIRRAAEIMAYEELDHVATLRRERRRAYHAERSSMPIDAEQITASTDNAALESRLADLLDGLAPDRTDAPRMREFAREARMNAAELAARPIVVPRGFASPRIPDDPVALSEMLVDRYLEAAEGLRDEKAVARAQALAGRAINRLAWLRADLPEIDRAGL